MTEEEKVYYEKIRKEYLDQLKIARAIKWGIYVILIGGVLCWMYFKCCEIY